MRLSLFAALGAASLLGACAVPDTTPKPVEPPVAPRR